MRRIYTAFCPQCPARIVTDEMHLFPDGENMGHDIGLAMGFHIDLYHPELFMTIKELYAKSLESRRN